MGRVMKFLFFLTSVLAISSCAKIEYCSDEESSAQVDLERVTVTGCEDPDLEVCVFSKGEDVTISIPFTPSEDTKSVTSVVHGIVFGTEIFFPLPNPNGCVDSGLNCPLKAGELATYTAKLPVREEYPSIACEVKWELQDKNKDDLVCLRIKVQIE